MLARLIAGASKVSRRKAEKTLQRNDLSRGTSRKSNLTQRAQGAKIFRENSFHPGTYRQRGDTRQKVSGAKQRQRGDRPLTKAQISKNLLAQVAVDLQNQRELLSEQDTLDFLSFMEANLESIQASSGKNGILRFALNAYKTFRASRASWFIFWTAGAFVFPQFIFGIFSLAGFGTEKIWITSWLPGETLYFATWYIATSIGIITMLYALVIYLGNLVNCFGGVKFLVFAICIGAYCIPFPLVNALPWFILWLWVVTCTQGKKGSPAKPLSF